MVQIASIGRLAPQDKREPGQCHERQQHDSKVLAVIYPREHVRVSIRASIRPRREVLTLETEAALDRVVAFQVLVAEPVLLECLANVFGRLEW